MRTIWVVVVVLLVGASGCIRRKVFVPNTIEGNECRRQCMLVYQSCMGGRGGGKYICRGQENDCLKTCPGVR